MNYDNPQTAIHKHADAQNHRGVLRVNTIKNGDCQRLQDRRMQFLGRGQVHRIPRADQSMQTKRQSLIETVTDQVIAYIVAIVNQIIIFPVLMIDISIKQNLLLAGYFTIFSMCRRYLVRRYFNTKHQGEKQ